MTDLSYTLDPEGLRLVLDDKALGFFNRFRRRQKIDFQSLADNDRPIAFALARLRGLDADGTRHRIDTEGMFLDHWLLSRLDDRTAAALRLPKRLSGIEFHAETRGTLGNPRFVLDWWWDRNGRQVRLNRVGAIVEVEGSYQRLPAPIFDAIEISRVFDSSAPLPEHWAALARFREALNLGEPEGARPEGFLRRVSIVTCDRVGLDMDAADPLSFAPLPFVGNTLERDTPSQSDAALDGAQLKTFQAEVLYRGAQPAYSLGDNQYIILDPATVPVVEVIARYAKGSVAERQYFVENAETIVSEAIERALRQSGQVTDLMIPEQQAETLENALRSVWTETREWTERVIEIRKWTKPEIETLEGSGTNWLPPDLNAVLGEILGMIPEEDLAETLRLIDACMAEGRPTLPLAQGEVPVTPLVREALRRRLELYLNRTEAPANDNLVTAVLPVTHDNFWALEYVERGRARPREAWAELPASVTSSLHSHQRDAFIWQVEAWQAGLPGILNADEQGLGKTLQTLAFLSWLAERVEQASVPNRPILIVAPTSLLRTWEAEIGKHLAPGVFGSTVRLYGSALNAWRKSDVRGRDTQDGQARLDLSALYRGSKSQLVITTYQTLANYAVSFAEHQFAVAVFDEIQNLKNPATLRASTAKAVNADFRIGLTGTPVENATRDIWAIMDQLYPGALGALADFRRTFDAPRSGNMRVLHQAIFQSQSGHPALGLRRTKAIAASDLPTKTRILHPRLMPEVQALRYDEARRPGQSLFGLLHHIRRTSLHPGLIDGEVPERFRESSARIAAAIDILRLIASKAERALVFIENLDVQEWFAELVRLEFGLKRVDIINGGTPVAKRQEITDHFQRDRSPEDAFDVLILGPRAAGTGLTLTAANHVIHLTRWWNPAVEEQCNDRTHRIGQRKPVTVHIPLAIHPRLQRGSFDCLLQSLMHRKRSLADSVLWPPEGDETEVQALYDAIVTAQEDQLQAGGGVGLDLADHPELLVDELSPNTIRVSPRQGGASVICSTDATRLRQIRTEASDVGVIVLAPGEGLDTMGPLPISILGSTALWPDFILPE